MEGLAAPDGAQAAGRVGAPPELGEDPEVQRAFAHSPLRLVGPEDPCEARLIGPREFAEHGPRCLRRHRMRFGDAPALVVHAGEVSAECVRQCFREGAVDVIAQERLREELPGALARLQSQQRAGLQEREQMRSLSSQLGRRAHELEAALAALRGSYDETLLALVAALDYREKETAFHSQRVAGFSLHVGVLEGYDPVALENLYRGALLHDIGKIGIPDAILLKSGELSAAEWEVMRTHTALGSQLLARIGFLSGASDVPRCHHEAWDGSGYPAGLAGEAIPHAARIFAIVDSYDAIRSKRPYKPAQPHAEALALLRRAAGRRLDPRLVDLFCSQPERSWDQIARGARGAVSFEQMLALCQSVRAA